MEGRILEERNCERIGFKIDHPIGPASKYLYHSFVIFRYEDGAVVVSIT
jgi:hypothetical protein